jgi:hypothetical protein
MELPIVGEDDEKKCLRDAEELKLEGNDHFRAHRWGEALTMYKTGLARLPKRKEPVVDPKVVKGDDEDDDEKAPAKDPEPESSTSHDADAENEEPPPNDTTNELDAACAAARAVLNANTGACYVKLVSLALYYKHSRIHTSVARIQERRRCVHTMFALFSLMYVEHYIPDIVFSALLDDPHYVKALKRRAETNEIIDSWSSLVSAKEGLHFLLISHTRVSCYRICRLFAPPPDYTTLLQILPPSSPDVEKIKRSLWSLQPRIETAQKRDTAEMLQKLKGLGNSILGAQRVLLFLLGPKVIEASSGNFGLSTDNFKFEPNGQGGYSMNFQR